MTRLFLVFCDDDDDFLVVFLFFFSLALLSMACKNVSNLDGFVDRTTLVAIVARSVHGASLPSSAAVENCPVHVYGCRTNGPSKNDMGGIVPRISSV